MDKIKVLLQNLWDYSKVIKVDKSFTKGFTWQPQMLLKGSPKMNEDN